MRIIASIILLASIRLCGQANFEQAVNDDGSSMTARGYLRAEFKWDMEGKAQAVLLAQG